jgi:hypothetical protein
MSDAAGILLLAVPLGLGATALMDLWGIVQRRAYDAPPLDYALLGRWIGHMARGQFRHTSILAARPIQGERALGWLAHYLIGVGLAALLLGTHGADWALDPTLAPALLVGLASMTAPLLLMQPAFGLGIAASRTPHPGVARWRSLVTHLVFGLGLFLAARCVATVLPG